MREIKFRVWSVDDKQFVKSIYHTHTECYIFIHAMFGNPVVFSQYGEEVELDETKYIIQQFTGCHDSTNKEIYEGDIVKTIYVNDPVNNIGSVIYNVETGTYRIKTSKLLLPIVTYRFVEDKPQGLLQVADEIVGNIFEDPELIK